MQSLSQEAAGLACTTTFLVSTLKALAGANRRRSRRGVAAMAILLAVIVHLLFKHAGRSSGLKVGSYVHIQYIHMYI